MKTETAHTPTPWKQMGPQGLVIQGSGGENIGSVWSDKMPNCEENAEYIVRAANAHDDLVEFVKYVYKKTVKNPIGPYGGFDAYTPEDMKNLIEHAEEKP